jgi:hypothetical protein
LSLRDDLHELVRLTALVVFRGTVVGLVASLACGALSGVLVPAARSAAPWLMSIAIIFVVCFVVPAVLASIFAAYALALERRPHLGEVLKRALLGAPTVAGMCLVALGPVFFVSSGVWLIVETFRSETGGIAVFVAGALVLLLGVWTFARYVLLALAAFFVDPRGMKRSHVLVLRVEIRGHEAMIFATGALPLLGVIAVLGHEVIPAFSLSPEYAVPSALAAVAAIVIGTIAVATGAYAVIDASRPRPSLPAETAP